jgi:microcystin-dependent protein
VHQADGYVMGATGGVESVALSQQQIPAHAHALFGAASSATSRTPTGAVLAMPDRNVYALTAEGPAFNGDAIGVSGGSQSHSNLQPFVAITYIIALVGVFPQQG